MLSKGVKMTKWECFQDKAYYDLWAVRPENKTKWGECFHVQNKKEAEGLRNLLNDFEKKILELEQALENVEEYCANFTAEIEYSR
jgi:hypothetical protein